MSLSKILWVMVMFLGLSTNVKAQEDQKPPEGYLLTVEDSEGQTTQQLAVGAAPTQQANTDEIAHVYTSTSFNMPVVIVLPLFPLLDVTQSLGIQTSNGVLQAEIYAGLSPSNALNGDGRRIVVPYGGRVRIAPIALKQGRLFVEYDRGANLYNHKEWGGQLTKIRRYQAGYQSQNGKVQVSVGLQTDVHNAWDDEDHAPEPGKSGTLSVTYRWNVFKKNKSK